ncbi:Nematode astacin protease 4, putative [Brugia malayi]|uniref:Metalloendopeptidase n=2 Tax=Brugia TaxID=6278 RepID=A0A0H5S622_BRUMA|nr:Nematode astacin protease 4, putative [Brugia malayi]CRZ24060.1 Bm1982 [Brugia malayi]VIO92079.1 Nematode astacin protease 4, putative [Brugia malayi]
MALLSKCVYLLIIQFVSLLNLATAIKLEDIIIENGIDEETTLTDDDFAKAPEEEYNLTLLGIQIKPDPTMGNMTEGDIVLPSFKGFIDYRNSRLERSAVRQFYRRWPNGEIPYAISSRYGPYSRSVIAKAMRKFHDISCVRFVPRVHNQHSDYLYIMPHDGCYSLVGRAGGRQLLSLEADCIQSGTIIHELMHAVGFFHEQSRPDRDEYIEIMWQNVMRGAEDQFDKQSLRHLDILSEPYDYSSIMHYGPYAFSGNGRRTIIALKPGAGEMGQRESLSKIDIRKINKLYSCSRKSKPKIIIDENSIEDIAEVTRPVVPLKPTAECSDKSWRCIIWSLSIFDYCSNSKKIANDLCPKSCGTCSDQLINKPKAPTATPAPPPPPPKTTKSEIETIILDLSSEVPADTAQIRYTTVTTSNNAIVTTGKPIGLSTGNLELTTTTCRDLDYSCPILVRITDCDDFFPHYSMKTICPFSCGFCSNNNNDNNDNNNNRNNNNNRTPKKPTKKCEDRGSYITCKLALFFNECDEKVNLCAKTCGAC